MGASNGTSRALRGHFAGRVRTIVRDQGRVARGDRRIDLPSERQAAPSGVMRD